MSKTEKKTAFIDVMYKEFQPETYQCIIVRITKEGVEEPLETKYFHSGDPEEDWKNVKAFIKEKENSSVDIEFAHMSSVDHFLMDGGYLGKEFKRSAE